MSHLLYRPEGTGTGHSTSQDTEFTLQPENVLLATPGSFPRVVIADFGLARERSYEPTANVAGTVSYLPPEAINALAWRETYSSETTDSWALGLLVFIMLQWVLDLGERL